MRGLIGCEVSGKMRRAMAARGHDIWSVDLLPAEDGSNRHIVGDVRDYLDEGWDFLAVMHPPCTRLCRAGVRWLFGPDRSHPKSLPAGRTWDSMKAEYAEALDLFVACWRAPIDRIAIENPRMHKWAALDLPADLPKPQIVQPWWFGEPVFKATGWYLKGLPPLKPTKALVPPKAGTQAYKDWSVIHRMTPGPDRVRLRSQSFDGMCAAAADQWGGYVESAVPAHAADR